MDRIYELSKSGIEFILKENNAENSQEPELTSNKPLIFYNPPEPPMAPKSPQPPILQGLIVPRTPEVSDTPIVTSTPVPEPEKKKRGIFDRIKREK